MGRLRILHFRRLYPLPSEAFVSATIAGLTRQGAASSVLSIARLRDEARPDPVHALVEVPYGDGRVGRWMRRLNALGTRRGTTEPELALWPLLRRLTAAHVEDLAPDVVLAHFGPDGCLIAPVAARLRVPLVVAFYGYDVSRRVRGPAAPGWRRRYAELFERAAAVVAISGHVAAALRELGCPEKKLRLVPLGCDLARFPLRDPARRQDEGRVRVLFAGRLTAKKDPLTAIRAVARARELLGRTPALELELVGDGELRAACERELLRLGLGGAVRCSGALPHDEVARRMGSAHLYLQPSRTANDGDAEGLCVTLLEAAATGLPVVATRHAGMADALLEGRSALLADEGDVEGLARHLAELARSPGRWSELGRAGRLHVEERFDLERTSRGLKHVLEEAREPAGALPRATDPLTPYGGSILQRPSEPAVPGSPGRPARSSSS